MAGFDSLGLEESLTLIREKKIDDLAGLMLPAGDKNSRWADRRNLAYLRHLEKLCKLSGT